MQGQLSELDIRSILQLIELGQRTGELYVEAYAAQAAAATPINQPTSWVVFFMNGQIVYAGETSGQLNRLHDYLAQAESKVSLDRTVAAEVAPFNLPEYGMLWTLLEKGSLSPHRGRTFLRRMVEETLFELLSLHHGTFVFQLSSALSPQLTTFAIAPLVAKVIQQVQEWHRLQPHIQSVSQRPTLVNPAAAEPALALLLPWLSGQTTLVQLARYLHWDILRVAKTLYPYTTSGIVQMVPSLAGAISTNPNAASPWQRERVPRIVCIDDGLTVRQTVEKILDAQGYEVTSIANPLRALGLLFQLKPDLILCDIAMPELEGYQLCAMMRQAALFREVPIIMLTGKGEFIDRIKARMAGATDYLTKPFGEHELLTLVEQYVGQGNPNRSQPEHLLAEEIADVLNS
ncbi:MAG: response regulator [Leptolyngbya sp. SIO4C1]|nr:response regulator [Leptolyngbya sp. SIO4C1]